MAFPSHRKLLATPRGYSWEFFLGVCRPVLRAEFRPYFRPKNVILHTRFQTWKWSQNATYTFILTEIMSYLLRLERQQNDFFLSYSFIIETTNILALPNSLVNHTRFWTKMGKIYTRFQTKSAQNHTLWGGT